jgi:hypothetical protein
MNFSNHLEVILTIFLAVLSIWIIERVIAGAFKTVVFGILFFGAVFLFTYHKHQVNNTKTQFRFTVHDLIDYKSFKQKLDPYTKETVKDIKFNFNQAKKNLEK